MLKCILCILDHIFEQILFATPEGRKRLRGGDPYYQGPTRSCKAQSEEQSQLICRDIMRINWAFILSIILGDISVCCEELSIPHLTIIHSFPITEAQRLLSSWYLNTIFSLLFFLISCEIYRIRKIKNFSWMINISWLWNVNCTVHYNIFKRK